MDVYEVLTQHAHTATGSHGDQALVDAALRAYHVYYVKRGLTPPVVSRILSRGHQCSGTTCEFWHDVMRTAFVCTRTATVHLCGDRCCQSIDGYCTLTGLQTRQLLIETGVEKMTRTESSHYSFLGRGVSHDQAETQSHAQERAILASLMVVSSPQSIELYQERHVRGAMTIIQSLKKAGRTYTHSEFVAAFEARRASQLVFPIPSDDVMRRLARAIRIYLEGILVPDDWTGTVTLGDMAVTILCYLHTGFRLMGCVVFPKLECLAGIPNKDHLNQQVGPGRIIAAQRKIRGRICCKGPAGKPVLAASARFPLSIFNTPLDEPV